MDKLQFLKAKSPHKLESKDFYLGKARSCESSGQQSSSSQFTCSKPVDSRQELRAVHTLAEKEGPQKAFVAAFAFEFHIRPTRLSLGALKAVRVNLNAATRNFVLKTPHRCLVR